MDAIDDDAMIGAMNDEQLDLADIRESVANIVDIAQSIEKDIMRLAPYLTDSDDLQSNPASYDN